MFERYTEKARRVIFFARYESSQFGSPYIETEHLLLGLLREDKALSNRFLRSASAESIRKQIEGHTTRRKKISTKVELPLSSECQRVLANAVKEAESLSHRHIGTEHLLLGLLCEEKCFAAEILRERSLSLSAVREELALGQYKEEMAKLMEKIRADIKPGPDPTFESVMMELLVSAMKWGTEKFGGGEIGTPSELILDVAAREVFSLRRRVAVLEVKLGSQDNAPSSPS